MKLKRRRSAEVPPMIKSFINNVTSTPVESISEPLKSFFWEFDKGDFHHWVDLFNHFDSFFEKYIKTRNDLQLEDNLLESDPPFPRDAVLQILRVIRIILENCTNKHFYTSYEHHIASLLACTDADVLEACLQTLAAFLKKFIGKYTIRDTSLNSRLFSFAQGWGGKEEGLGLISCALQNGSDQIALQLGCTLHFEFYSVNDHSSDGTSKDQGARGLQIIHISDVTSRKASDLELLNELVVEYKVPHNLRFSLLTRLRFARAFGSLAARQQYTCIRLYAFVALVQTCGGTHDLVSFLNTEPEFINELVTLLRFEDEVPERIRILSLLSLVALCQDRSHQPTVLTAVTSGGHRGILSSLMQKAMNSVVHKSSKCSIDFAEALLSLVTVLVSSSSGCSAMREAGFVPALLPLLKDSDPQHLHLVTTAVHVLEAFMDYSNPAAALFRDLGGLDNTISRLMVEVSHVENVSDRLSTSLDHNASESADPQVIADTPAKPHVDTSAELDGQQPLCSETSVSYHRRLLMKALLRAISLGTYAPGTTTRVYGSEESMLPHCLCIIFKRAKDFGGGVFSLAATVMSDLIHKDPTCFSALDAAGLPSAFMDAIMDGVVCSAEAINCIPQCLDALCLNNSGLNAVKERNALRCFVKIFTSKTYLRALAADTPGSLSSGLDELMRHASSLRGPGVEMLIEILLQIAKNGSGHESASVPTDHPSCSQSVPMEMESENVYVVLSDDIDSCSPESCEESTDLIPDVSVLNVDSSLPDCISNVARLLETVLQNSETCRMFVEKKGIEYILKLFTLPLLPPAVSLGQSIAIAFKNFSPQHSVSLGRAVCSFLRDHLKSTNELLALIGGAGLAQLENSKQFKVLRCLSCLDSILTLCNSLIKASTAVVLELGSPDADVWKDLGKAYKEILWQVSLCCDLKAEEKQNVEVDPGSADIVPSNVTARGTDNDVNIPSIRYMNPVSIRNSSHPQWGVDRDFISVVRSGEGFSRRSRHSLPRLRSGRTGRHLEAFHFNTEALASNLETPSIEMKKKSPEILISDNLNKLSLTMRSFFTALVKCFASTNRRRTETGSMSSASKNIGTSLANFFLEALSFSGYSNPAVVDISLSVKCRYLGKVVDDMAALTFDIRRRTCYPTMINNFYVHGTFKELLTTFEATSELLWALPHAVSTSGAQLEKSIEGSALSHSSWLLDTLESHCRELEFFVNSGLLLSSTSPSVTQQLIQPVAVGLSIGLFPVPREPESFVRLLQSQVLDVTLPLFNNPMFPRCSPGFITSVISLITHVYNGVGNVKQNPGGSLSGNATQLFMPPPDEATIATIVEMGFSRARAEEALRRVETNSVEMAMEWLFNHVEDPVQEDDELARALALSLGSSSEATKVDSVDKSADVPTVEGQTKAPPADDILATAIKLFHGSDSLAFPLTDLLVTLCSRNKGEDRSKVISYLVHQLKLCPLEFSKDNNALGMISHTVALLLSDDVNTRDIAVQNGVVLTAIDILMNFMAMTDSSKELLVPKCITSLLLILDSLVQPGPKIPGDTATEGKSLKPLSGQSINQSPSAVVEEKLITGDVEKNDLKEALAFEIILGKPTGYLTMEESHRVLLIACDLIKRHVQPMVMQAVLQLCARLTKSHVLAIQFLENGGLVGLFGIPRSCFFPGYDTLASAIIRHLLEDPQTLQTAMELEIRQNLSGSRHAGRISARTFLTSMAHVLSRDPGVFMRAVSGVCQLESSGGRHVIVLSKEKEKEKDKLKASDVEAGVSINESVRISESKAHDGSSKYSKGHKKVSPNLTQVIDYLLEIVSAYPSYGGDDRCTGHPSPMEVDEPTIKLKGKLKADETVSIGSDYLFEKSSGLTKVTFVLKLLSDILLMYAHAVGVILKRDLEMCQSRGLSHYEGPDQRGIIQHVLHILLPLSIDKSSAPEEWREKLSERASWFLVVLAGRSSEGRRRVVNELVKALSSFVHVESNSSKSNILPDKKVISVIDLVYSILSKNSSSGNLPGSGCSPDIAKSMIDGGVVQCLSGILQVIDLDHPNAPKAVNLILKSLESLTRAANTSEQVVRADTLSKKKPIGSSGTSDALFNGTPASQELQSTERRSFQNEATGVGLEPHQQNTSHDDGDHNADSSQTAEQDMRIEDASPTDPPGELGVNFMREDIEESGAIPDSEEIELAFHVENRVVDDMNDEEDEMVDDGDDDEDDDGEDEDDDIAEDGRGLMSLADTDVEDNEDSGLGDEYNDDMVDEADDDFQENRVIEVRWRDALDGLDHLQVLGQPRTGGLVDVSADPFEGVSVDDFLGIRRSFGFERRRHANRTSHEPSAEENGLQHPLLSRPSHPGDLVSVWSTGGSSSRESDGLSSGSTDISHFYMFDAPPLLPYDNASTNPFGNRHGGSAAHRLADFSVGLESLRVSGRRGPGDGRWTDDGQIQAVAQAAAIAQAVEEQFISQLSNNGPAENAAELVPQNPGICERQYGNSIVVTENQTASGVGTETEQNDDRRCDNDSQANQLADLQTQELHINMVAAEQGAEDPQVMEGMASEMGTDVMESGERNSVDREAIEVCSGSAAQGRLLFNGVSDDLINSYPPPSQDYSAGVRSDMPDSSDNHFPPVPESSEVRMDVVAGEGDLSDSQLPLSGANVEEPSSQQNNLVVQHTSQTEEVSLNNEAPNANGIDPTFLEALPEDLRAEVLASQQAQTAPAPTPTYAPPAIEDIDPEFLAALPPDIQAEVLAQQRARRITQQSEGHPVDMDNASIIATFPADLREEVLLTSSEAVLSALPSPLLAEAQMLRDRAMSHYHARSLFGSTQRLSSRGSRLGFGQAVMDRGVGVTIGRRASSIVENLKLTELEGEPLLDADGLKALIRLLRLAQPLGKGLLQRLLLNLCSHSDTRSNLVHILLDMINPETVGRSGELTSMNTQRLYGCQSNVVYGCSQLCDGVPPLVLRRVLEILTYLATNHAGVASSLFLFDASNIPQSANVNHKNEKGKDKVIGEEHHVSPSERTQMDNVPLILFLRLLSQPLFLRSIAHLEQVMGLLQVVVYAAASKVDIQSSTEETAVRCEVPSSNETTNVVQKDANVPEAESNQLEPSSSAMYSTTDGPKSTRTYDIFLQLPQSDLHNLCNLLGHERLSEKVYTLASDMLRKLASVAAAHRKYFVSELSGLAQKLSSSAVNEIITLRDTHMLGLSAGSMAGAAVLRVLQILCSLTSVGSGSIKCSLDEEQEHASMWKLYVALEPLWKELSECISSMESVLNQNSQASAVPIINSREPIQGSLTPSPPLPSGTQRLLPFIEGFFVLCEKLQAQNPILQQDNSNVTAREVKESTGTSYDQSSNIYVDSYRKLDGSVTFSRFSEKHRRLLNAFVRQNPSLLEKSLSMLLKAPRLIDFDNKRAFFRSRIRQQHDQHLSGPLRVSVRRAYILEDSYNQLRMRPTLDLKGRLNVHFQGEEGIDAGGLTREWYQLLSRVVFDKGALLFTTVGNNATFQPNPNSVYQTEHLSYFRFVGRVVAKALFDGQLLDVYFTRSFYKHMLGVKVTYHDIEAVDPDYYKNLKWMLENDVSDVPDLTFSMDADEEKHILYEKTEVTDYELKPGGRNIRVTEETKHEYVDLVADHILTNAIRPQINAFLEGFNELVPRDLISLFNDKELELLISGLPEIDLDDLKANAEYSGYTAASIAVQWFWEVVKEFNKEDMARLLQFVTGTSKVPLEGFKALQGISGPQRFQIHKAYGAPKRLPSAHTCFNQLDLPEYSSKEQLEERLLLAIHEGSEGFGFG